MRLRDRALKGVFWISVGRFGEQGCIFLIQLVLARLLAPEQFAVIAMALAAIGISRIVIDAGFGQAIIQRKEISDADCSSVFYLNFVLAFGMAGILYVVAPLIAGFYREPELASVTRAISVTLLLIPLGVMHEALLRRELNFKALLKVRIPAMISGGAVGIGMALAGHGVWALVGQNIAMAVVRIVLLWVVSPWRPKAVMSRESIRTLFPYGSRMAVAGLIEQIFQHIYVLVIGRLYTLGDLGQYSRAQSFQRISARNIQSIIGGVTFPIFSSVQGDLHRLRRGFESALQLQSFVAFPLLLGMAAVAEPMIVTLIGAKWMPAVPFLKLLCVVGALWPLHALNLNILTALGRANLYLRLEFIKKGLLVIGIVLTARHGIEALIVGQAVCSVLGLTVNTYYTRRLIDCSLGRQLRLIGPILAATLLMFGVVAAFVHYAEWAPWLELVGAITLGVAVYLGCMKMVRFEVMDDLVKQASTIPVIGPVLRFLLG